LVFEVPQTFPRSVNHDFFFILHTSHLLIDRPLLTDCAIKIFKIKKKYIFCIRIGNVHCTYYNDNYLGTSDVKNNLIITFEFYHIQF